MMRTLRFGRSSMEIFFDPKRLAGHFEGPLSDGQSTSMKVAAGLASPIDAPPFVRGFAPGDRVGIAFDAGLPDAAAVLAPIFSALQSVGVELADISLLLGGSDVAGNQAAADALKSQLLADQMPGAIVRHDPSDESQLAYLATSKEGRRIYLARELVDADATLTVGLCGHSSWLGFAGSLGAAFPALSNVETIERSLALAVESQRAPAGLRLRQLCEEVGWLLGTFYSVNVSLDRTGAVDRVFVGQTVAAQKASDEFAAAHWTIQPPTEAIDLVVASVGESSAPSTWPRAAAAMQVAAQLSATSPILLLADVDEPLGPTGGWLVDNENHWETLARLRESRAGDVIGTAQMAQALNKHKVYLHSRHAPEFIESMGMVPIAGNKEVQRLVSAHKHVYLAEQADRVAVARRHARPQPDLAS